MCVVYRQLASGVAVGSMGCWIACVLPCVSRWSSASIFVFDEVVGGWGEDGGALVIQDQRRKSWVGALVSGKPNQRREKTKERVTLMEERENGGWS